MTPRELARWEGGRHGDVVRLLEDGRLVGDRGELSRFSRRWVSRPDDMVAIATGTLGPNYNRVILDEREDEG